MLLSGSHSVFRQHYFREKDWGNQQNHQSENISYSRTCVNVLYRVKTNLLVLFLFVKIHIVPEQTNLLVLLGHFTDNVTECCCWFIHHLQRWKR
ncbi:unnamed protein product [Adineta ricciae]|uniref:Uncharacterized protein n=1 Tax=Adineta ricciae TaxID=249248 RepID=A0A815RVG2_ADIRI|nr:unnamed protein product [Adineta ricciae]